MVIIMKINKIIIDIAVIIVAFLLFVVWHQHYIVNATQTTSANMKYYKIYLITTDKGYQY
ncbi:MAG TPA: hypothetical protein VN131_00695 [Mobilitalea sp.]|nr:hypothetical protein [Mobilitalea sp.]